MAKRYAVTGLEGQVVRSLIERSAQHPELQIIPVGRPTLDLGRIETVEAALISANPDAIISCAAYTAVDQAETDEANAFAINAAAVGEVGRVAKALGIPVVHLSTDYVFDGEKTSAYLEDDPVNPLGAYGRTKLEGERLLASSGADHAILRTAWVYSAYGKNFLKTMLRLAETRDDLNVVADQIGNPTSALDIADAVIKVADNLLASDAASMRGIFHMTGTGDASWADFAAEIFSASRENDGPVAQVHPITTAEYPTPARRPKNSRLDCGKLAVAHGVIMPTWQSSTSDIVRRFLSA
ncbi:dTDP-4-dehydrorhamnose reductase [Neorhizobium alkalisoli]|uniref:dTDP-4-dehydrorhamnose reductase n=1 Tax=Neorhizobium alkalisoli TaxID=528178 RepID=A0A561R3H9_9HYPH|nr:dTDP-4-dehydrorhamnose reductase [Neorhizobium alkalisoli]TWF57164.1 dTDP-4-dehydrorhamnose reductase [Neorhizobium alkalisoli]